MFLIAEVDCSKIIPAHSIVKIVAVDGGWRAFFGPNGQDSAEFSDGQYRNFVQACCKVLPAEPGTFLLDITEPSTTQRFRVVGWAVNHEQTVTPLVVNAFLLPFDTWFVQHPDGSVESSDGGTWSHIGLWQDEMQSRTVR